MRNLLVDWILVPCLRAFDYICPKDASSWVFATHFIKTSSFIENPRAVFELVKAVPEIRKIIFYRGDKIEFTIDDAVNYEIVRLGSFRGFWLLVRSKVIFLSNSVAMDFSLREASGGFHILKLALQKHIVVNLWHGIPLKRMFYVANAEVREHTGRVSYRQRERKYYSGLVASSDVDSYVMAATFFPLNYKQIWLTGLPRNDFLLQDLECMPKDLFEQILLVRKLKNGKRLITYAPTYRQSTKTSKASYYQFSQDQINNLKELLEKHNAIFGFRMHYFRNDDRLFNIENYVDNEYIFDLGHEALAEIAPAIRESDIVVSDYSSVFIEAIYANKPIIGFAYDLEQYKENLEGLLYDYEMVFPGPVVSDFDQLLNQIDNEFIHQNQVGSHAYERAKKFFFKYQDTDNSQRVVDRVNDLLEHKGGL